MRATLLSLFLLGCGDDLVLQPSPTTLREHLATETSLVVSPPASTGGITAERRTTTGWEAGFVELGVAGGDVAVLAEPSGTLLVQELALDLVPIEIPSSVIGRSARLIDVHVALVAPTRVPATWVDDDEGRATASLQLELSWALEIDGATSPIGSPRLPLIPVTLRLTGGARVEAEIRVEAMGPLWSWADLVRLEDLTLVLAASS
jgi:hypothetical protein